MFNHCRHISLIVISTTIKLWSWFDVIVRTEVTICREIRRWNSDYSEKAPSAVTMAARSTSGSVSSLIILSSASQTCCSAHRRHLHEFCVPTESEFSANMLKTVAPPPPPSGVAVCHVSASPRPVSLLAIGFVALLLLVFTRPTSERCSYFQEKWARLQIIRHTTGILQTRAASWTWESNRKSLVERREELNKVTPRTSACLQTTWCCWYC